MSALVVFVRRYRLLEEEMDEKEMQLNQGEIEIQRVKAKEKTKRQLEREKIKRELDRYRNVEAQLRQQTRRFQELRDIIDAGATGSSVPAIADSNTRSTPAPAHLKPTVSDPKLTNTPSLRVSFVSFYDSISYENIV